MLGEIVEYCQIIGVLGDMLLCKVNGRFIEMLLLLVCFCQLIVVVLGVDVYVQYEWFSFYEVCSFSVWIYIVEGMFVDVVQILFGYKYVEMMVVYFNDCGFMVVEWKQVVVND